MNLLEYESKRIFQEYGIPIPKGKIAGSPEEAGEIAENLGEVVLKAQVQVGGRGKAGGIKFVSSPEEAVRVAEELLDMQIKGFKVEKLLVEEKLKIEKEFYAGITVDRAKGKAVFMVSREGGVDIEEIAKKSPEKILTLKIHTLRDFYPYHARELASFLGLSGENFKQASKVLLSLYKLFKEKDATLAEINPLVIANGRIYAADAKIVVDEDAWFRQDFSKGKDLPYVELSGNIGCIVNGAGLAMATMDTIKHLGGEPANFLDIGGGAGSDVMEKALKRVASHPNVRVILINILGGITRCDEIAKGIVEASSEIEKPLVVRLRGTKEKEGVEILRKAGYAVERDMIKACEIAIARAKEAGE